MADKKISELTAASTLSGAELLAAVQSGATVKITLADLLQLAGITLNANGNILLGQGAGSVLTTETGNVIVGAYNGADMAGSSNSAILSAGDGNYFLAWYSDGNNLTLGGTYTGQSYITLNGDSDASSMNTSTVKLVLSGNENVARIEIGDLAITAAGKGLKVSEGTGCKQGKAVLVEGFVTVNTTTVTANSRIFVTSNVDGGTPGFLRVNNINPGVAFDIRSSDSGDTSTVAYEIFEPA